MNWFMMKLNKEFLKMYLDNVMHLFFVSRILGFFFLMLNTYKEIEIMIIWCNAVFA